MWETWVRSLGWEDPLEKGTATHSSVLAWRTPWAVQAMGSQRVGHDWATFASLSLFPRWDCRKVVQFLPYMFDRIHHWRHLNLKLSGPGAFCFGRLWMIDSITLIDTCLFRLSISSYVSFSKLCPSRHAPIFPSLSNLWTQGWLKSIPSLSF